MKKQIGAVSRVIETGENTAVADKQRKEIFL